MRAVLQRVESASVEIEGQGVASIGAGILALVGFARDESSAEMEWMARKIAELRIFEDAEGKMNRSLLETGGELLVVSQFTLYGDCRKGRRPSYSDAAPPAEAERFYEEFLAIVQGLVPGARSGQFQAMMRVPLVNSGPVTLLLDSRKAF